MEPPPWLADAEAALTDDRLDRLVCTSRHDGWAPNPWASEPLPATGGGTFRTVVCRHHRSCLPCGRSHAVVSKVIANPAKGDSSRVPLIPRELAAYRDAEWFAALPKGIEAPRLLDAVVLPSSTVVVFDDVGTDDRRSRSIEWYGILARRIGQFNGTAPTRRSWFSQNHLRAEGATSGSPTRSSLLTVPMSRIEDVSAHFDEALSRTPPVVSHLELFSRNVGRLKHGEDPIMVFDWATVGPAPIGTDAATLFALTLAFLDVSVDAADEFEQQVCSGYLKGLDDVGCGVDERLFRGNFAAIAVMRYRAMMANAAPMAEAESPRVAETIGLPLDVVIPCWERLAERFVDLAEEARSTFANSRSSISAD